MSTGLFIAAYDIANTARRRRVAALVRDFAREGQLSAYECELTPPQRRILLQQVAEQIDMHEDRFVLIAVHKTDPVPWQASPTAQTQDWLYLG